ncbi:hypothetical protein EQ826_12500 [Ectopseudomonas mendocina]|nr:hypothetical protein [Pseudomonas mendocina]TRO25855.1 hypothetical protein EQ828_02915 [Pseudomonas mendocina]TRO25977.1 hypothetical protein EQ826_12500 [Pseudomonas mendocina]
MLKPRFGKSGLRDYLYYLFNQGESLESPKAALEQMAVQEAPHLDTYKIGLIAATQAEADRFLGLVEGAMHKHLSSPTRQRFTAYGLDQAWRPLQLFDEVHWIHGCPTLPLPQELLASLGSIVHIHLLEQSDTKLQSGLRAYRWRSESDLTEFLASLYLSREICWFLELDWESYFMWQPCVDCIATVSVGWGATPSAAVNALLASAETTNPSHLDGEILIIEGGIDTRIGDYIDIVDTLERSLELDFVTTGWVSLNYSGYGLKLLRFSH